MYKKGVRIRISWAFLDGKDFNLGIIRNCLNFDGAALGVVKAENWGADWRTKSLGLLGKERNKK